MDIVSFKYAIPYYTVFLILFYLAFIYKKQTVERQNVISICSFGILLIFFGCRGYVYSDWISYLNFFNDVPLLHEIFSVNIQDTYIFEPGFVVYTSLLKTIWGNFHFFIFISSLIDLYILFIVFKRYLTNPIWGFVAFFAINGVMMEINLLRNMKSIMLFLYSLKFIQNRQIYKYLFCNILGVLFHQTSILFLPLYFFLNKKISKKLVIVYFLCINIIYVLQIPICQPIILGVVEFLGGNIMLRKAVYYFSTNVEYGLTFAYIERALTFLLLILYYNRLSSNKSNVLFINMFILYLSIYSLCWDMEIISSRGSKLFIASYWFLFPLIFENIQIRNNLICVFLYFVMICSNKLILNNNNIMAQYDNLCWGIKSKAQREMIMDKYFDKLLNQ